VQKVYPDAKVIMFMPKMHDPTDPTIMIPENYEPEGEQIDEFQLPGTGTVMAPKTDPKTGVTSPLMQRKFLGINVGNPQSVKTGVDTKFGRVPQYTPQQVQRYNAQPNRPSTIKQDPLTGFQQSVAKPSAKPPTPTSTPPRPSTPTSTPPKRSPEDIGREIRSNIDKRNKATQDAINTLRQSYQPEGEVLDEVAAWQRSEGKKKSGGLNEKGRKSYERENPGSDLKAPSKKVGNPRRASFCARMKGMKKKLTSAKTANDPNSRINKSLRAWNC